MLPTVSRTATSRLVHANPSPAVALICRNKQLTGAPESPPRPEVWQPINAASHSPGERFWRVWLKQQHQRGDGFGLQIPVAQELPGALETSRPLAPQKSGSLVQRNRKAPGKSACVRGHLTQASPCPVISHHSRPSASHSSGDIPEHPPLPNCKEAKEWLVTGPRLDLPGHHQPTLCFVLSAHPSSSSRAPPPTRILDAVWPDRLQAGRGACVRDCDTPSAL